MIVVDRHAFDSLWPALAIWLLLFVTAGDAWTVARRQAALAFGAPVTATIIGKHRAHGRDSLRFSYVAGGRPARADEAVGPRGWRSLRVGQERPASAWAGAAFLDDDFGYSRWKLGLFGAAFAALWLWALARYRFG